MSQLKVIQILILLFIAGVSYSQSTFENLCKGAADNIYKQLKKANIPDQSKIAVLYFEGQTGSKNSMKTLLGIRLSNKLAVYLAQELNKTGYSVLFPENTQEKKFFSPPADSREAEAFYTKFNQNKFPDYFVTAKYYISGDYSTISVSDIVLKENQYSPGFTGKTFAFEPFKTNIVVSDVPEIKSLHIEFSENDDYMNKILQFTGNTSDLFDGVMMDLGKKEAMTENSSLIIKSSYTLKVNVKKPCYMYIFYYSPDDKDNPYLIPLYPYGESEKPLQPGEHLLPTPQGIEIGPPVGNTYIKLIGSPNPLRLDYSSIKDKDGYYITKTSQDDAQLFHTKLNNCLKNSVPVHTQMLVFKVEY